MIRLNLEKAGKYHKRNKEQMEQIENSKMLTFCLTIPIIPLNINDINTN